jgi:hypothetical protein
VSDRFLETLHTHHDFTVGWPPDFPVVIGEFTERDDVERYGTLEIRRLKKEDMRGPSLREESRGQYRCDRSTVVLPTQCTHGDVDIVSSPLLFHVKEVPQHDVTRGSPCHQVVDVQSDQNGVECRSMATFCGVTGRSAGTSSHSCSHTMYAMPVMPTGDLLTDVG